MQQSARAAAGAGLAADLARARNADGGWGYYPGKASRLEPTAWALLARAASSGADLDAGVLLRWPRADGWLTDVPGVPVNMAFQALSALVLRRTPAGRAAAVDLATRLLDVRGARFDPSPVIRQDNSLQAWPWVADTFSWVEPTSMCLLLVKHLRGQLPADAVAQRIDIGERMLLDRACGVGGWNYGGSNVYGQELHPYVPTTAWGLLALQDRRQDPVVVRSVARLAADAHTEPSAVALSMAAIALQTYGQSVDGITPVLVTQATRTRELGSVLGMATALYALTRPPKGNKGDDTFTL